LFLGNRGGRFHRGRSDFGKAPLASRQWICCVLSFRSTPSRLQRGYTALFFLDEATAPRGAHRPCFDARRADATLAENGGQAKNCEIPHAPDMDLVLQAEV